MSPLARVLALLFPIALGTFAGRIGLFSKPRAAIANLNRFALFFAFPSLIFVGVAGAEFAIPTTPAFWLAVPVPLALTLFFARLFQRKFSGSISLSVAFGNVAYLGLPLCAAILGEEVIGLASLSVAVHVGIAMLVGPYLLLRWSGDAGDGASPNVRALLKQPLLWATPIALLLKPVPNIELVVSTVRPLASAAAPVALFMLGLYLYEERTALRGLDGPAISHVVVKLILLPMVAGACIVGGYRAGWLDLMQSRVLWILAAMPSAITTFSIAEEFDVGVHHIAKSIVLSSVLALATVPGWLFLMNQLFELP